MENTDSEKSNKNNILKQEYKIYSLRDALWFKQKYLKFELPDNIEYPIEYDDNEKIEIKSDKKVKRLSRLLTKREQKKIS